MGESSSEYVTIRTRLVAIDILIVKRGKMPHQKHESFEYVPPLKNSVE